MFLGGRRTSAWRLDWTQPSALVEMDGTGRGEKSRWPLVRRPSDRFGTHSCQKPSLYIVPVTVEAVGGQQEGSQYSRLGSTRSSITEVPGSTSRLLRESTSRCF